MGHEAVANAAVVGVAHPKWDERPILLSELKPGAQASADDLKAYLDGKIARWWMPDDVLFVDSIPLGPTGQIDKKARRAGLEGYTLPSDVAPRPQQTITSDDDDGTEQTQGDDSHN